jgi:alkaline phosphatase
VSTAKFEDDFNRIGDRDMHPDLPNIDVKYAKYTNGKSLEDEKSSSFWLNNAKAFVEEQLKKSPNTKKARNIIMFLGDGMSHPTIASARVHMGGEERKLSFEHFPFTASSKTYCVDKQVADSACTATAYLHGVKANDATIGLSARALRTNCSDGLDRVKHTESIASWAMKAGKDAGFVTTTRVTHASPAGVYAHIADRDWENDAAVVKDNCDRNVVDDIAEQLVYGDVGKKLKVMMGGGSKNFISQAASEHSTTGNRTDGKNLINEWKAMDPARTYINNRQQLMDLDPARVKQVLGLFNSDHIRYNLDIQKENLQNVMPSLKDMTLKAIDILDQNEEGYFLFVEGGRIDHGHHKNEAKYAVDETAEFSKAIEAAIDKVNTEETLIVVTADHGHVMTLAGYAVSFSSYLLLRTLKLIRLLNSLVEMTFSEWRARAKTICHT